MSTSGIDGQLNATERRLLAAPLLAGAGRELRVLEVGTWLGGGSTLTFLRTLEQDGRGRLWGIEADRGIYDQMLANLRAAVPEAVHRFTPLFGFSQQVSSNRYSTTMATTWTTTLMTFRRISFFSLFVLVLVLF